MLKEFYQLIADRLKNQIPDIQTIQPFNKQIENEKNEKPFRYPAVFFDFTNLNYRSETTGTQKIDVEFELHVATSELRPTFDLWDLCEQIGVALQNYSGDNFSDITQRNSIPDNDHDRVNVWRLTFGCTITDESKLKQSKQIIVNSLGLTINKDLDIDNSIVRSGDGI